MSDTQVAPDRLACVGASVGFRGTRGRVEEAKAVPPRFPNPPLDVSCDLTSPATSANLRIEEASSSSDHVTRVCSREVRFRSPEDLSVERRLLQLQETRRDQAEQREGILPMVVHVGCSAWLSIRYVRIRQAQLDPIDWGRPLFFAQKWGRYPASKPLRIPPRQSGDAHTIYCGDLLSES